MQSSDSNTLDAQPSTSTSNLVGHKVPIDPHLVEQIEEEARAVAESLDALLDQLRSEMLEMSTQTRNSFDAFFDATNSWCETVDSATARALELITRCDQLDKDMSGVEILAAQIKTIKSNLDALEKAIR
ncbi:uncharacterized protein VTP21DRAFT_1932 [Calcarisporiella thermophila]|uniref:uncharacterized protein n=1 Tax=Calcarisporiella thermophila TaxID=911321 RepID=UPI00374404C6